MILQIWFWWMRDKSLSKLGHDDVIKWLHFPSYWPFVRGIRRSPVNSPHKGQWLRALTFSMICAWINGWVNNREAGDLRRHRTQYDATVMDKYYLCPSLKPMMTQCTDAYMLHWAARWYDVMTQKYFPHDWPIIGGLPSQKTSNAELWCVFAVRWTSCWTNSRVVGDLRRHGAHCMTSQPLVLGQEYSGETRSIPS